MAFDNAVIIGSKWAEYNMLRSDRTQASPKRYATHRGLKTCKEITAMLIELYEADKAKFEALEILETIDGLFVLTDNRCGYLTAQGTIEEQCENTLIFPTRDDAVKGTNKKTYNEHYR